MQVNLQQQWVHNFKIIFSSNISNHHIAHIILYHLHVFKTRVQHNDQHIMHFGINVGARNY